MLGSTPVLEWYTPPSDFSHGTYFGLARCGNKGDRCGYLATQDFHGEFRECEFPLEELEALEKTLNAISIPLGSSVGAFDAGCGLIRIYHGRETLVLGKGADVLGNLGVVAAASFL